MRDDEDQDHDVSLGTLLMVVCLGELAAAISVFGGFLVVAVSVPVW
ncbi:hypothetical protein [Streptomyces sp. NPDC054975]